MIDFSKASIAQLVVLKTVFDSYRESTADFFETSEVFEGLSSAIDNSYEDKEHELWKP